MDPIAAAAFAERDELDDALIRDNLKHLDGFGEVLWISRTNRIIVDRENLDP